MSSKTRDVLKANLPSIDDDTLEYFESMIDSGESVTKENVKATLAPFIESYGLADSLESAEKICEDIVNQMEGLQAVQGNAEDELPTLLKKAVVLNDVTKTQLSAEEKATVDTLWGFENVRKKRNEVMEFSEAASAKFERKAAKEQRKWLDDLESQFVGEEDNNKVSTMMIPDFSEGTKEKDIHVHNFNITYGGKILLENADLRLVYGRKYGLIGRNGIGKTTLLKHMANFDIEGFPRHHRVLHVKQEVKSSTSSVLNVVLESDVERNTLLAKEQDLQHRLAEDTGGSSSLDKIMRELEDVHERLNIIGAHSAEGRAAMILSGLQFTEEMQNAPTDSLSGGWRMRVAIAAALFIEPDLLMLDEPTNHLDLEAVLWLEKYLRGYEKTVLLVSHDRAFLNDVCTDIILFDKLQLFYYRGNFDMFEGTRKEMQIVQQKQHEAQQVKIQHMQEFVDKFRYNAKRASLVQSRIKSLEKETVIEAVEEETEFKFSFFDAGQLGRPIIQIEGVTFGFPNAKGEKVDPLFHDVHLSIDQSSRVALVGPNGAGKSTLLNLIQNKLVPWEGFIRVNPQLKLGVFTQHHMDSFDLSVSPLTNMMNLYPGTNEAEIRAHLGRYEVTGPDALKPMKYSSGGQKSRVAFASLTFAKPHVVIMDEPTNHLDMGAIEALIDALKNFHGGVLVVSHDQHFITHVCNELWIVQNKKVSVFGGSFDDYKKSVLNNQRRK